MRNNKTLRDFAETETSLSRTIKEQAMHEHTCMSHQFAHILTQPPFPWTFDELREEYKAQVIQRGNTVLVLFDDLSCCEFKAGSIVIDAHAPGAIEDVMRRVTNDNPVVRVTMQETLQ